MQKQPRSDGATDAITLLIQDHKTVQKLFKEFDRIKDQDDDQRKKILVQMICTELTVHTLIEEEIFYPTARDVLDDADLFDEAAVEHASVREMIYQLEAMEPYETFYDAKVTVLGEYVNHHIKEEQEKIFPKVEKANLNMPTLTSEMIARKQELQADQGTDQPVHISLQKRAAYRKEKRHSSATGSSQ